MSGKKDFQELFNEMAAQLLEKIEERNEEFLEQIRAIQGVEFYSLPEALGSPTSASPSGSLPAIAPRVGISETAQYLFVGVSDEKRRMEYMWRFSQMQYAQAAEDWIQWGAYLIMILEGLCGDCLPRFLASRVGLEDGAHQMDVLASLFVETRDGPLVDGLISEYGWGIHEGLGTLLPFKGTTYHKVLLVDFLEDSARVKTLDEYGNEHLVTIQLDKMPESVFSLDVRGIYLDQSLDSQEEIEVHRNQIQLLIGPLPRGRRWQTKDGKQRMTIRPGGSGGFTISETPKGFSQLKWPKVYYIKGHADKGNEYWNLNLSHQPLSRRISEASLIDRMLLTELLLRAWDGGNILEMPSDWGAFRSNPENDVISELIEMRNAYCHNNAVLPNINVVRFLETYESRLQNIIVLAAAFLKSMEKRRS